MKQEQKKQFEDLLKHWNAGNLASHLYLSKQFTNSFPKSTLGWLSFAAALSKLFRYKEARRALAKALSLCPTGRTDSVFQHLGHLYKGKGDFRRAETWYRKALEVRESTGSYVFLGACLAKQTKFHDAKECFKEAIRVSSDNPDEAYFNLGLVLRAEEKYQEALECFSKAVEYDMHYEEAILAKSDVCKVISLMDKKWSIGENTQDFK